MALGSMDEKGVENATDRWSRLFFEPPCSRRVVPTCRSLPIPNQATLVELQSNARRSLTPR